MSKTSKGLINEYRLELMYVVYRVIATVVATAGDEDKLGETYSKRETALIIPLMQL